MSDVRLREWLQSAGLEQYLSNFEDAGITSGSLLRLTLQDYSPLGVVETGDRRRLFQLIQKLKVNADSVSADSAPASGSTAAAAPIAPAVAAAAAPVQHTHQPPQKQTPTVSPTPAYSSSERDTYSVVESVAAKIQPPSSSSASAAPSAPANAVSSSVASASSAGSVAAPSLDEELANVPKIRVVVRKRPLVKKEVARKENDIVTVDATDTLTVHEPKTKVDLTRYIERHQFTYDDVFDENADNRLIYERTARGLIAHVFNKGNATCFAYGQTGSGKTHTMLGAPDNNPPGIYLLASEEIFRRMQHPAYRHLEIVVSFYEIYGGKLFDLLNQRQRLFARENAAKAVQIVGLKETVASTERELIEILAYGNSVRSTGATGANADSSRSHAVLQICLKERNTHKLHGRMAFIDLAGSERGADTLDNNRQTRLEGAEINKSLLALKECIRALDLERKHTPFRGSKLTQVLKDCFTGNSRTVMIANISPGALSSEHTLNTLRYADRVKEIKSRNAAITAASAGVGAPPPVIPHQHRPPAPSRISRPTSQPGVSRGDGAAGRGQAYGRNHASDDADQDTTESDYEEGDDEAADPSLVETQHANLVSTILNEEDEIISHHRQQIDDVMDLIKREMRLLAAVEQPGADIDSYVNELDDLLATKIEVISLLRGRLADLKERLLEEEELSRSLPRSPM